MRLVKRLSSISAARKREGNYPLTEITVATTPAGFEKLLLAEAFSGPGGPDIQRLDAIAVKSSIAFITS
jgi:hypothetical protein